MQSVSSRIWTRVAVSISYYDNHYTTGTSLDREDNRSNYERSSVQCYRNTFILTYVLICRTKKVINKSAFEVLIFQLPLLSTKASYYVMVNEVSY